LNIDVRSFSPTWPTAPSFMFSITDRRVSDFVSWNVRTMPLLANRCGAARPISFPSKLQRPVSGRSKPVSRLKNVVLPAPLGPMSAVMRPRWTCTFSTSTATRPPNARRIPLAVRIGSGLSAPGV
jgi:hypothetical protein